MENIKLYVMNEEQSRKAQEKAFSLGLGWFGVNKKTRNLDRPFLFFDFYNNTITHCSRYDFEFFQDQNSKELTFEQWMSYEPETEEMTDSEILGKVWKRKDAVSYYIVSGYDPQGEEDIFQINDSWWSKQELLKDWQHAESLQAVAKENE